MKRLTLILILMLSVVFFTVGCSWIILDDSSASKGKLATSWDVSNTVNHGDDWLEVPDEAQIGDIFTGSSGTTYKLQVENITPEEEIFTRASYPTNTSISLVP